MALIDPHRPTPTDGPHPALCLAAGFGVIIGAAILVHIVFNSLV